MQLHILHKLYKSRLRELLYGGVRGLGVRGLGLKQKYERLITEAKVVSFLRISPFTYEQLQKISRIHRNTLKLRLDQLASKGIILKHRYSIPFEWKYYGYTYRYPVKYRPPLFNHIYYLLNLSNTKQIQELVSRYLIRREEEWEADLLTGKIGIRGQPSFSLAVPVLKQLNKLLVAKISDKQHVSPSELKEMYQKSVKMIIHIYRWNREYDLSAVKNRVFIHGIPLREDENEQLKKIIDFFTNKGFPLQDILVRCSTEHTLIEGDRYYYDGSTDPMSFPMTNYSVLWDAIKNHGYLENSLNE